MLGLSFCFWCWRPDSHYTVLKSGAKLVIYFDIYKRFFLTNRLIVYLLRFTVVSLAKRLQMYPPLGF